MKDETFEHPNWVQCDHNRELVLVAQNITTITEKILIMEQLKTDPSVEKHFGIIDRLIEVLQNQLEDEYQHREKMYRLKALRELGMVPPFDFTIFGGG
jgi:hypothetical protein